MDDGPIGSVRRAERPPPAADRNLTMDNRSVDFFERQFQEQIARQDFNLNPFEELALRHLRGTVLDLGCGLGNLALAAARRSHRVVAVDASHAAVERIREVASRDALPVDAIESDISTWRPDREFDSVAAIGLLMFFAHKHAVELLENLQRHVRRSGVAVVNVLIEGTTFLKMFDSSGWCLFGRDELPRRFDGWTLLESRIDRFDAPGGTQKVFSTVVAERTA